MINHVAIIPDGNRRWAKEKGILATLGHNTSGNYDNLLSLCNETREIGVKYLSIWAFSTENWKRDINEVNTLFDVISRALDHFIDDSIKNKFRFIHLGKKDRIPKALSEKISELEDLTKEYDSFNFVGGIDYGGREEIIRAVNLALKQGKYPLDEREFNSFLYSSDIPEPDLIIRTGGEKRLSGFMPFQSIYSELYFTDIYFPDFKPRHLKIAIEEYKTRKRRFGE